VPQTSATMNAGSHDNTGHSVPLMYKVFPR
jgi:hypothetical protein